ncbi:MAG: tyrosinase family protein [Chitinophagaceae bacterium]
MATTQTAERIWKIFSRPTPPQRKAYLQNVRALKEGDQKPILTFSHFNSDHMKRVKEIVDRWNGLVNANGRSEEQLLNAVLDDFESMQGKENPDLLYFSLEVFITHFKGSASFSIPSILVREPELTAPSKTEEGFVKEVALGSAAETKLDWFREDPLLNEHHAHWHVVYDTSQDGGYDRQGEMFFYMHQQMLARYDAERVGEQVPRVAPFSDMRKPIKVGYTVGPDESISQEFGTDREPNKSVEENAANWQVQARKLLDSDIDKGLYDPDEAIADPLVQETNAINSLGSTIEANKNPQGLDRPYRSYHGAGHNFIGDINQGVMFSTVVAIRDVVFWEWHKEVDTHYVRLQERFDPYNFSKDAPPVVMRNGSDEEGEPDSMDVILCFSKDIPGFGKPGFDGAALGEQVFGNDSWDKEFANESISFKDSNNKNRSIITTNTLVTTLNYGTVKYEVDGEQKQYDFSYLNHEPFSYFIRVQNTSHEQKLVTVRIFIAPASEMNDRTCWIELDKFRHELQPDSKTVIFRSDTESSVIRKPAVQDPTTYNITFEDSSENDVDCKCGWPYHLLIPKGGRTEEGGNYKLVVMMSDGEKDSIKEEANCGSLSFCAAKEAKYPDKRPLGYPFNRKFKGNGNAIINTITTQKNFACRSIKIQHTI